MPGDIDTSFIDTDDPEQPQGEDSDGTIPDADLEAARDDPVAWAENLTLINGDPVDYSGGFRFWKQPLRDVMNPESPKIHIWKMARGMGKTEQSSIPELMIPTTNRMKDVMHSVPRQDQLNSYMNRTMSRKVQTSVGDPPILETMLDGSSGLSVKRNEWITGSFLEGRSAWGDGRSIQGFHGCWGTADECQNWTSAALQNLKEAIDTPLEQGGNPRMLLTGTPDYEGTVYHEHWQESDQRMWQFDCPECDTGQTVTLESVEMVETNPKQWEIFCRQCGRGPIDNDHIAQQGYWEPTNPDGIHRGYSINQLVSARHPLDEVMRSRELASVPKGDFYRYKLARFYSGGAKPIPPAAIYAVCDDSLGLHSHRVRDQPYYVGVDWGGGESADTIAVVLTVTDRDSDHWPRQVVVRNVHRIEYESRTEELRKVAQVMADYGIGRGSRAVADLGFGEAHIDSLQKGDTRENPIPERGWGSAVIGHRFNLSASNDPDGKWPFLKKDGKDVSAAQPPWANRVFDLFPDVQGYDDPPDESEVGYDTSRTPAKRIKIPYQDTLETRETMDYWFDHLTAVKREYKETTSGNRKERITTFQSNQKDDGFYGLLYAFTAACLGGKKGGFQPMKISGSTA